MKRKQNTMQLCIHLILIFICILSLLPFLSMVSTSFMKVKGVLPDEPILLPRLPLYTQNYVKAWVSNHFQTYFVNTIVVSFGGVVVNLLVSLTMAYSFARFKFPGKEWMFNILLLTMMIPAQLAMISQYTVLNGLKLIDDYKGIWLLWGGTCVAGNTFFYRGFFESVPRELEESMYDILTFTKSTSKRTLSVALQLFRGQYTTDYGRLFAASTIVILPNLLLFVIFQKQFMRQGLTEGAVKE